MTHPPPRSTLFPYTTLFRSALVGRDHDAWHGLPFDGVDRTRLEVLAQQRLHPVTLGVARLDRKSTRLNSSHSQISYAVFCLKKKIARGRGGGVTTAPAAISS